MNYINLNEEERRVIDAAERWEDDIDARLANSYYEGEKRKAIKTALRLLELGDSIEKVADVVELPIETIIKIQRGEIFDI
jgi:uncharacterized protein Yka (UPF0111/DUF47 family)